MRGEFEARIVLEKLPLSRASLRALRNLDRYDAIVFTSKNALRFFEQELHQRRLARPQRSRIIRVGPREDLLKLDLKDKRVLFPRSELAPFDVVRKLRTKGAIVRVLPLYTASGVPLSRIQKRQFADGDVHQLYFKSPSAIFGQIKQFRGRQRADVFSIPARCIGGTTAEAARKAGFKRVFIR